MAKKQTTEEPKAAPKKVREYRDEVTCFRVPKRLKAEVRYQVAQLIDKIIEDDDKQKLGIYVSLKKESKEKDDKQK